jgi:hypothetical protein
MTVFFVLLARFSSWYLLILRGQSGWFWQIDVFLSFERSYSTFNSFPRSLSSMFCLKDTCWVSILEVYRFSSLVYQFQYWLELLRSQECACNVDSWVDGIKVWCPFWLCGSQSKDPQDNVRDFTLSWVEVKTPVLGTVRLMYSWRSFCLILLSQGYKVGREEITGVTQVQGSGCCFDISNSRLVQVYMSKQPGMADQKVLEKQYHSLTLLECDLSVTSILIFF